METSFKQFIAEQSDSSESNAFKTREFRVPVENIEGLKKKLSDLNKKAAKLGTKPNELHIIRRATELIAAGTTSQPNQYADFYYLTVTGEIPIMAGGWSFAGKLEPHPASKATIVKPVPGVSFPKKYKNADPTKCEHCKINRPRNETFIVKKGKTYKQVGRSCLKDFLGHANPERYAAYAESLHLFEIEAEEHERGAGGKITPLFDNRYIFAAALNAIKQFGFRPAAYDGDGHNTREEVASFLMPTLTYKSPIFVSKDDLVDADKAIAYAKEMGTKNKDDFWQNINKMLVADTNPIKYLGYLVAAANQYRKNVNILTDREKFMQSVKNEPIAPAGSKVALKAKVISAFQYARAKYSYYDSGVSQVLTMQTSNGNLIKMFSANMDIQKGDTVSLTGRIGKCEPETYDRSPFKGILMTMMAPRSRVKILDSGD